MSTGRLSGKIAMVTGASAGIGRAISLRLASEGAVVAASDIHIDGSPQTAAARSTTGRIDRWMVLDVSDEAAWETAVDEVVTRFGRLDVLVNNAGLPYRRPLSDSPWAEWQRIMSVNAGGAFLGMKHGGRAIADSGGGSIVNISSAAAMVGVSSMTTYSAAKGAIRAMSRAAAAELASSGVRVNSVYPTSVPTAMLGSDARDTGVTVEAFRASAAALSPLAGLASTDDVAGAVAYLAGDDARFVTGAEIVIDGGATSLLG